MKIPFQVWVVILLLIAIPVLIWHSISRMSYADPLPYVTSNSKIKKHNGMVVVGDDWASLAHEMGFEKALEKAMGMKVESVGLTGLTTRELYYEMAVDRLSWVVEGRPKYAVIFAGLNDHIGQYGPGFYAHHIRQIIDLFIYHGITPVVVGIPQYDVQGQLKTYGIPRRLYLRYFSLITTGCSDLENVDDYSTALLSEDLAKGAVYIAPSALPAAIDSFAWTSPTRLSHDGYVHVAKAIANKLRKR